MDDRDNPYRPTQPTDVSHIVRAEQIGGPVSVQFTETADDVAAWSRHLIRNLPPFRRIRWLLLIVALASLAATILVAVWVPLNSSIAIILIVALVTLTWMQSLVVFYVYQSRTRDTDVGTVAPRRWTVTINCDGVTTVGDGIETKRLWTKNSDVVVDATHVFLRFGQTSGAGIPKRAFESEQNVRDFVASARQFQRQAILASAHCRLAEGHGPRSSWRATMPDETATEGVAFIEYDFENSDAETAMRYAQRVTKSRATTDAPANSARLWKIGVCVIAVVGTIYSGLFVPQVQNRALAVVCGTVLGICVARLIGGGTIWCTNRSACKVVLRCRDDANGADRVQLAVDSSGIFERTKFGYSRYDWTVVDQIETEPDHAFFKLNVDDTLVAPKRAFPSDVQFEAFVETARQFRSQTTKKTQNWST